MKFCKECKWSDQLEAPEFWRCRNVAVAGISPVDGRQKRVYCDLARGETGDCGPEGSLWEARETA